MTEPTKMTLEEFRETAKENPQGFMFDILCLKCGSSNVALEIFGECEGTGGGCETCGYGADADQELSVLFKCKICGNAFHKTKDSYAS